MNKDLVGFTLWNVDCVLSGDTLGYQAFLIIVFVELLSNSTSADLIIYVQRITTKQFHNQDVRFGVGSW